MNKRVVLLLPLMALSVIACRDTSELYAGHAYVGGEFLKNHYSYYDPAIENAEIEIKQEYNLVNDENASARYFNGSGDYTEASRITGFGQAASWHPNDFAGLEWTPDIINPGVGVWADQSSLIGKAYGQTKKMALINDKFGRGILSKLYNGQIRCDAWSSYAVVELDKTGYGTIFPAELQSARYFAFAARGGSDGGRGRLTTFDVQVTFYKRAGNKAAGLVAYRFNLDDVILQTNNSSNYTSLIGFYFDEVGDASFDPNGIIGMSVTYSLAHDEFIEEGETVHPSDDFKDDEKYHTSLMLYEVFFPDSNWY